MSELFHVYIQDDRKASLKFDTIPDDLHARLKERVTALTAKLESGVRAAEPELTGRLRGETSSRVISNVSGVVGFVGIVGQKGSQDFAKAGALEYGAHRVNKVKAHAMRIEHVFAKRLAAPLTVMVEAFDRRSNIAAQNMFRGTLAAMQSEVEASLESVVAEVTSGRAA